jgi:hypothetical protein
MRRSLFLLIILSSFCIDGFAQSLRFNIGLGLDLDMGIRINDKIAPYHQLEYRNSALASADIFTKFSYLRFNLTPDFKISWATFGKGKRTATNESGTSIPEGTNISIVHQGDFPETLDRSPYLLNKSNVTVSIMNVGFFITRDFLLGMYGYFEAGTGFFYDRKQVNFKEYMAYDIYDYFGSTGSHITQYQTDEYTFKETKKDKKPKNTQRMLTNGFSVPLILQYNIMLNDVLNLSPALIAYFGKDSYYEIKFSLSFGGNYRVKDNFHRNE